MKNSKNSATYLAWIKKSEEDELSAEWLLREKKGSPSTVCFLSQQMVEKQLKSLLDFHKKTIKKTHDLVTLESLVKEITPEIEAFHDSFKLLNTLYIETRYPGDLEFTWELGGKAFQAAQKIKQFILDYFEKHESNGN